MKKAKKILKPILCAAALLLAVLLPFGIVADIVFAVPPVYEETFLGELAPKFERLCETDEPKLVLVGGSSVAFGFDSGLLSQYTGMEVVNFGLYATLGTKIMLDLSEANINAGDLILLAPEMDEQTLSLYFNAEAAWQAIESDFSMLRFIGSDNYGDLAGGIFSYVKSKLNYTLSGTKPRPTGIYCRDSFNEYGDLSAIREKNIMTLGYDANRPISLTPELFDKDFLSYLNAYIARAEAKGATVLFSFCPINRDALAEGTTEEALAAFYRFVCENVKCPVITGLDTAIMDAGYFYDTNFHLNDAGAIVHTAALIDDLYRYQGRTDVHSISLPAVPGSEEDPDTPVGPLPSEEDPWEKYFLYETYGKARGIVGVTEEGKTLSALELPKTSEGLPVRILVKNALSGCDKLTDLTIRENITLLEDGCLAGAPQLVRIHMRRETCDELEAGPNLFEGSPSGLFVYLYSDTSYFNFTSGYWWSVHSSRLKRAN